MSLQVAGYDTTRGWAADVFRSRQKSDAHFVSLMRDLGAIPFVLTNLPQSMLSMTCCNPVYGLTTNPFNKERTSGGSSGGEGAIVGHGASFIGLGNDIGGSIRVPAAFCGVVGFKVSIKMLFVHQYCVILLQV